MQSPHLQGLKCQTTLFHPLKMRTEDICCLKTLGSSYSLMQHHMPEKCNPQLHHCKNLDTQLIRATYTLVLHLKNEDILN